MPVSQPGLGQPGIPFGRLYVAGMRLVDEQGLAGRTFSHGCARGLVSPPVAMVAARSVLALGVAGLGLLAGWPLSTPVGFVWALILVVGLARSATRRELRLLGMPLGRVLLWSVPTLVLGAEIVSAGLRPGRWDLLLVTGVLAFVIAVEMAERVPGRMAAAFGRLRAAACWS